MGSRTKQSHLVIASYDGISTYYCGIGTTMQDTISALDKITNEADLKVSLAYVNADPAGQVYDGERHQNAVELVKKTGGNMLPLCNGTAGQTDYDMWQSFPNWHYLNASLATALNLVLKADERNVAMLHDTPYLLFHKFKRQIFSAPLDCYYMPRSSASNHRFGAEEWRNRRFGLENEAFRTIASDSSSRVLGIGRNFADHLKDHYDVSLDEGDLLVNGLDFQRYENYTSKSFDILDVQKLGINIPTNAKIIFAWGRASVAKGIRELVEAWHDLEPDFPDYYLIIQSPNNSGEDDYFRQTSKTAQCCDRAILIDDFDTNIWQTILRTKCTKVVCVPSIMDPIPHTAIEAKLFARDMSYVIVASNVDGVVDVLDEDECLWTDPRDQASFVKVLRSALNLPKAQQETMQRKMQFSLSKSDYVETIKSFLVKEGII